MNWFAWLQFMQALLLAYGTSQGKDVRALGYLKVAIALSMTPQVTDEALRALMEEYQAKVANQEPTSAAELEELDQRLADLSEGIQSA